MTKKITFLDKTFWITESEDNPKHVAGLQLLQLPENAAPNYVEQLVADMRSYTQGTSPFNCRVLSILGYPVKLVPVAELDMEYHVNLHVIEDLNDKNKLHQFVAGIHERWLDRDKPLWQFHLIKDASHSQFALYIKIHHMYGDGFTLIRWLQTGYSESPTAEGSVPVWATDRTPKKRSKPSFLKRFFGGLWDLVIILKDLIWILFRLFLKLLRINKDYMPVPFTGTKTKLTGQVKKGRAVATLDLDFSRIKALSKRTRASANEVMLCVFDIAVHRLLKDFGHSFDKALYTNMPINLRKPGEMTTGNKIAIVPVQLAHGKKDPYLRLRQIIANHRLVKKAARVSHPASFSLYTVLIQSYAMLFEMLHISDWVKPIANILVSNMPGPDHPMYFRDCKLLASYPISTITPGGGINITMVTYNGRANIGFVCCNKHISSLEAVAQYSSEAFDMLEACTDDPTLSIDDIGEKVIKSYRSIVDDEPFVAAEKE